MWKVLSGLMIVSLCLGHSTIAAPPIEWQGRLIDKYDAELYSALRNYINENNIPPNIVAMKRNSEIINSLLALPKSMAEVGR